MSTGAFSLRQIFRACIFNCLLAAGLSAVGCKRTTATTSPPSVTLGTLTFNRDVAPILFRHCAPCHRPGQSAPFDLLTYSSAQKHAKEIVEATQRRYMPPWLPEPGYGDFLDERRLSTNEIERLQRWVTQGAMEGNAADLPPPPHFADGWQLGEPDLILQMPAPYFLAASGNDLYRNFIIPIPGETTRFVQGVEFHANNRSVHHVRILLDPGRQSRHIDAQDGQPGFGGMNVAAKFPPGHMLTWVPGKVPAREPDGMSWVLEKDTDLVLQIHMQRTGKTEQIQPTIGLYFTNRPPSKVPWRMGLLSELIDIPAGETNYIVERSLQLPADVEVLSVLPHLHYLGRELQGFAILPNGQKRWLLFIKDWDFNWQGEYRFREPVFLPGGSTIHMRYSYDNSEGNARNPNHPPRQVVYGPQSLDEMGELWLQVLPRHPEDLPTLQNAHRTFSSKESAAFYQEQLRVHPENAAAHLALGKLLGPLGAVEEALDHFQTAIKLDPTLTEAFYYTGLTHLTLRHWDEAKLEFDAALQLNPDYFKAHDGLGLLSLQRGDFKEAEAHFKAALAINPSDPAANNQLKRLANKSP